MTLAVTLLLPRIASAEKRIVVLDFEGPKAEKFRQQVGRLLAKESKIVSSKKYEEAADEMRAKTQSKRNVRRVAKKIRADGVVVGEVKERRGKYKLTVRILSGRSGSSVGETSVISRGTKLSSKDKRKLKKGLDAALGDLDELRGSDDEGDEDDGADEEDMGEDDEGGDEDEGDDEDKDEDDEDKDENVANLSEDELADLRARSRAIIVSVGVGPVIRDLSFNAADAGLEPRGYNSGAVPIGGLRGEAYPLAFNLGNKGIKRDIGLSFEFERILQINTQANDGMGIMLDLPTEQQRFAIGVVVRKNFGNDPMSPTVKLSARYNRARFNIDKTEAINQMIDVDVPNVNYKYYDPGLGVRYPINPKTALNVEGRFLAVSFAGEIQRGSEYGAASITGFDADANIEYRYNDRLFILVGGRIIGFAFDFNPVEGMVPDRIDRNGDGVQDVGGALDRYLGGYLSAGYLF